MPLNKLVFAEFEVTNVEPRKKCYFAGLSEKAILEFTQEGRKYGKMTLADYKVVNEKDVLLLPWESPLDKRLNEAAGAAVCLGSPRA